jgi:hypothetical protein
MTRLIYFARVSIEMDVDIRLSLQSQLHELADVVLCSRALR